MSYACAFCQVRDACYAIHMFRIHVLYFVLYFKFYVQQNFVIIISYRFNYIVGS